MYHESTYCGMVTLTLTMLVYVLPSVLPSGSVPLGVSNSTIGVSNSTIGVSNSTIGVSNSTIGVSNSTIGVSNSTIGVSNSTIGVSNSTTGVSNSTIDYLLNSTSTHNVSTPTTPSSELTTLRSILKNTTLAVLLSNSSSAVSINLTTNSTPIHQSSTPSLSSSTPSSTTPTVTSSYALLTSLSSPPSSNSSSTMRPLSQSQNSYNLTSSLTQTHNASISATQKQSTQSTMSLPSTQEHGRSSPSTQAQSELQIVLVKKLLQKWGYMPVKKNGCWVFTDWRKEATDPSPVTCSTTQESATTMSSTPMIYESISELATSEFSLPNNHKLPVEDGHLSSLSMEEREKFVNGMETFQKFFHLHVTGRFDSPTSQVMKQRICGVPDRPKQIAKDFVTDHSSSESSQTNNENRTSGDRTAAVSSRQIASTTSTLLTTILRGSTATPRSQGSHVISTTPSEYETVTDLTSTITEIDYSFTEIVTETSSELVSDVMEVTPSTTDAKRTLTAVSGTDSESIVSQDTPSTDSSRRRRRGLSDNLPNVLRPRSKRTSSEVNRGNGCNPAPFSSNSPITWRIVKKNSGDSDTADLSSSTDFTRITLRRNISEAFRRWSEISTLKFKEKTTGSINNVDIWLRFVDAGSAAANFTGSEMAWSTWETSGGSYKAKIYFKDTTATPWAYRSTSSTTRDLLTVAVHEIGHILCLDHDSSTGSVMYPNYVAPSSSFKVYIDDNSKTDIKNVYGACTDTFTAFDWVRTVNGVKKYNTYLFRSDHYWIWENQNQRTRYGDPRNHDNVPTNLQAVVHVLPRNSNTNELYFFANGRSYSHHNMGSDGTIPSSTISSAWGRKNSNYPTIPNNIKAAYFDKTNSNVYFFNSTHVFAYDRTSGQEGCCLSGYPKPIGDAYTGENGAANLESNIDGAYYSISDHELYFFKGNHYWETTYEPAVYAQNGGSNVKVKAKQSNKHEKWKHVCDV